MAAPLRRLMTPYQGPSQTVVGLHLALGQASYLWSGPNDTDAPAQDLMFEIGSITKVFTGILLYLLVEEGKVDPKAPLSEMSGIVAVAPPWLTPERLVSHTGGLPNLYVPLWKAMLQQRPEGPYARFSRADLLSWLAEGHAKDPGPRPRHRYSNLGVGLLAEAIAIHCAKPFRELLSEKLLRPLGLNDTVGDLNQDQRQRFMSPHSAAGKQVAPWIFDALAGAGFLRSTASDLARFSTHVIRAMQTPETPLDHAIRRAAQPIFGLGGGQNCPPYAQCAGWVAMQEKASAPPILFANGGTAGSTCALYVCSEKGTAAAILSNAGIAASLWASARLQWSNPTRQARGLLCGP